MKENRIIYDNDVCMVNHYEYLYVYSYASIHHTDWSSIFSHAKGVIHITRTIHVHCNTYRYFK